MKNDSELFLVFFVLALSYTCFLVYTSMRLIQSRQFVNEWKYARLIYIFQFIQLVLRSVSFWLICAFANDINSDVNLIFLTFSLPDSLIIASFIVLFWIMINCTRYTRIDSECSTCGGNNLIRAGRITLLVLLIWLFLQFMLYGLLYLDVLINEDIGFEQAMISFLTSAIVISGLVIVQVKYSGLPFKTVQDGKFLKTVLFVTVVWIIGRTLHGVLYLIRAGQSSSSFADLIDTTQIIVLIIIDLLVTELTCYYFILDYSFFRIFSQKFIDDPITGKLLLQDGISLHSNRDTGFELDDASSGKSEVLSDQKGKLGQLCLTEVNKETIVVRKIKLPRMNKYVAENLQNDIENIRAMRIPNLACYRSCNISSNEIELVMKFYEEGSLFAALHVKSKKLSNVKKLEIAQKIAETMDLIHKTNKAHGHLSSFNVLLLNNSEPFLADLGLEHLKKFCGLVNGYTNKSAWSSPELLKDRSNVVTKPVPEDDIYSFGIILWELMFDVEPFPGYSLEKLREMVVEQGYRPAVGSCGVKGIEELIISCWNKNPSHRPDAQFLNNELMKILMSSELEA